MTIACYYKVNNSQFMFFVNFSIFYLVQTLKQQNNASNQKQYLRDGLKFKV